MFQLDAVAGVIDSRSELVSVLLRSSGDCRFHSSFVASRILLVLASFLMARLAVDCSIFMP